jgi:hypothetical protein
MQPKIASAVGRWPQAPQSISRPRLACGCSPPTLASSSPPFSSSIHWLASTIDRLLGGAQPLELGHGPARRGLADHAVVVAVAASERPLDPRQGVPVLVDREQSGLHAPQSDG